MGRIFFMALIGAIAGLLAWAITSPLAPLTPEKTLIPNSPQVQLENPSGGPSPSASG